MEITSRSTATATTARTASARSPALHKATDVTLKRGVIGHHATSGNWLNDTRARPDAQRTVLDHAARRGRQPGAAAGSCINARPMKWTGPTLAAQGRQRRGDGGAGARLPKASRLKRSDGPSDAPSRSSSFAPRARPGRAARPRRRGAVRRPGRAPSRRPLPARCGRSRRPAGGRGPFDARGRRGDALLEYRCRRSWDEFDALYRLGWTRLDGTGVAGSMPSPSASRCAASSPRAASRPTRAHRRSAPAPRRCGAAAAMP